MNSFIRTATGLAIVVGNKPYTVESNHQNYSQIVEALREKRWNDIPNLISVITALKEWVGAVEDETDLEVDAVNNIITFRGEEVRGVIAGRILDMYSDGFDVTPMSNFLANLYQNPSARAVEELYGWMEKNGITITEDGYLLAFKRVANDYTSFYDGATLNTIGSTPELPRNRVDDRSDVTCSYGLHFCSQAYLPEYHGGIGRVLLLKINPADVVSIPTDYNSAKGRACKYLVLDELKGDARAGIETHNVIPQPVVMDTTDYNASDVFKQGYSDGYKDGRGKKAAGTSYSVKYAGEDSATEAGQQYAAGYQAGRTDGRNKNPKLHQSNAATERAVEVDPLFETVRKLVSLQLGIFPPDSITMNSSVVADLGADSLDEIELVMALEDEFGIEIVDHEAEKCVTVRDAIQLINRLRAGV